MATSSPITADKLHRIIRAFIEGQEDSPGSRPSQRRGFHIVTYFKGELHIMPGGNVSSEDITMALEGADIQFEGVGRGLVKVKIKQL